MRCVYARGRTVGEPRVRSGGLFALSAGAVVLFSRVGEKRVPVCHRKRRGDLFALGEPECAGPSRPAAEAVRDGTTVFSVSWTELLELGASRPAVGRALAMVQRKDALEREEFAVDLTCCDSLARTMYALYLLASQDEGRIVHETRGEIAWEAVASRKEVTRALPLLQRWKLVEMERYGRKIRVPNLEALLAAYRLRREM